MSLQGSGLEYETAAPRQSRLGLGLLLLAVMTAVTCVALLVGAQDDYLRLAAAASLAGMTWFLAGAGKRRRIPVLRSIDALEKLVARTEIPVAIYLRRFVDDQRLEHPPARESDDHDPDEEQLARYFGRYCLFVAVGRPGEPLPPWGAYRLYLEDREWEQKVAELISLASVIFVKWADSEPLNKELQLIREARKLDRTIFLLPLEENPHSLCHYLPDEEIFEIEIPEKPNDKRYAAFCTLTETGAEVHYRDRELGYGEAARQLVVEIFNMENLTRNQLDAVKGFYGNFENLVSRGLFITLYSFAGCLAVGMLLMISALIVIWLEKYIPAEIYDFVFAAQDMILTPLGWMFFVSLGLLLLLVVISQRSMP